MVWGWIKAHHRNNCKYNYKKNIIALKKGLPITLVELMPFTFVRRAFNHCVRFMAGYRGGLTGAVLEYAVKKYKSHRRLSPNLKLDTIVDEFTEHRKKMKFLKLSKSFQHEIFSVSVLLLRYTINWEKINFLRKFYVGHCSLQVTCTVTD